MKKKLSILLIEDDSVEVMKFNRVVSQLDMICTVKVANDGEEALAILANKDNLLPDIILLDLNMPKISGLEFLKILKNDKVLKYIPTIMLTTSSSRKDLLECYQTGVSGYILKPLKYEDYVSKITKTLQYWQECEFISILFMV